MHTDPKMKDDWTPEEIGRVINHGQNVPALLVALMEEHVDAVDRGEMSPVVARDLDFLSSVCQWYLTKGGISPKQQQAVARTLGKPYYLGALAAIKNARATALKRKMEDVAVVVPAPNVRPEILAEAGAW